MSNNKGNDMTTETTALTLPERASVALGSKDYELKLAELVKSSVRIVAIKNGDAYKEAHGARMALKNTRVAIEKAGKAAREDATAFSKAIIAEEKRLVAMIDPEESRLQTLQEEWDAAREAERQAKLLAEQERIDGHRAGIDAIKAVALQAVNQPSSEVQRLIDGLTLTYAGPDFEEFQPAAEKAKAETLATLHEMHAAALAREAEAARLEAERIERERQQAEEAARLAAEREELARLRAQQEAREAAERARVAAEQKAEAERLAAERRKLEEEQRVLRAAQAEADRKAAEARAAEQARLDAERAEIRRQQDAIAAALRRKQDEEAAAARAEADRIAAEARKAEDERIAAERAEAERLRQLEEDERRRAAEARAKTSALRSQIDAILDGMNDAELAKVLKFVQAKAMKEAA